MAQPAEHSVPTTTGGSGPQPIVAEGRSSSSMTGVDEGAQRAVSEAPSLAMAGGWPELQSNRPDTAEGDADRALTGQSEKGDINVSLAEAGPAGSGRAMGSTG